MASWKGFGNGLAKVLVKVAVFAAEHPDVVQAALNGVKR